MSLGEDVDARIKRAVIATFAEVGLAGLTVERICAQAEVSHSTFHRQWHDADDVLLATLDERIRLPALPDTGCLLDDLIAYAQGFLAIYQDPTFSAFIFRLMGEALSNRAFAERLAPDFVNRRANNRRLTERAVLRGELTAGCDADRILDGILTLVITWAGNRRVPPRDEISCAIERLIAKAALH